MSGSKPLVSVIIPAYNHEKYVQETINSIIEQTYQNIELIVIDDGSKDKTWEKINELKPQCDERFMRTYFETKQNEGTCVTLNKLIEKIKGEYVYLIASDDIAKSHAIKTEVEFLSNNPDYALVVGDSDFVDEYSKICYWDEAQNIEYDESMKIYKTFSSFVKKNRRDINFDSESFGSYKSLTKGNYVPNGYLIRSNIFKQTGLFTKEAPLEDYWLMLQISKYSKLKYLDDVLFSYRWHTNNTSLFRTKMIEMTTKTQKHEKSTVSEKDEQRIYLPSVREFLNESHIYKRLGIPYIFEFIWVEKYIKSVRYLQICGIKIITKVIV